MATQNTLYVKESNGDTSILYLFYFSYIISAVLPVYDNSAIYVVHFILLPALLIYLLLIKGIYKNLYFHQDNIVLILAFAALILISLCPPLQKHTLYFRLFILKIMLLSLFMASAKIDIRSFSQALNISYLVYLSLSVIAWLGLLPGFDHSRVNSFIIHLGTFHLETLFGVSGSTAHIDTYSGLVFLWNFFMYKGRYRFILIALSLASLFLTFRKTPVIALLLAALVYILVRSKLLSVISMIGLMLGFIGVVWLLYYMPEKQVPFLTGDTTWYSFFWYITHSRSSLWVQQCLIYSRDFTWYDYLIGPDLAKLTVPFIRPDGYVLYETFNPHNAYLILLFRSTFTTIILSLIFLYYLIKKFSRPVFAIIFYIATAAMTNSSLFTLENPIYVLVILFILIKPRQKSPSRAKLVLRKKWITS